MFYRNGTSIYSVDSLKSIKIDDGQNVVDGFEYIFRDLVTNGIISVVRAEDEKLSFKKVDILEGQVWSRRNIGDSLSFENLIVDSFIGGVVVCTGAVTRQLKEFYEVDFLLLYEDIGWDLGVNGANCVSCGDWNDYAISLDFECWGCRNGY